MQPLSSASAASRSHRRLLCGAYLHEPITWLTGAEAWRRAEWYNGTKLYGRRLRGRVLKTAFHGQSVRWQTLEGLAATY